MADIQPMSMARLRLSDAGSIVNVQGGGNTCDENDPSRGSAKKIYFGLSKLHPDESTLRQSRHFLSAQLHSVAHEDTDLPLEMGDLASWMASSTAAVGRQYQHYLAERRQGGARRYFPTRAHALHFIKAVAPTKLVDGAWLYGLVSQWRDQRYSELIRIYLEELGEGDPRKNHVVIYKKLLARYECDQWATLDDSHFVQGAIQLSLARHAGEFLPEIIGFNLGYEQLPLHLLICAYELKELNIDPYYFTLHVTIDNAASGHAARAVQAVVDAMPRLGNSKSFYQRVRNGYRLNALGAGTNDVIANFDLEQELLNVLTLKAGAGAQLHSDYCRVDGKTINEWLSGAGDMATFVQALQKMGWIRRNENPEKSRFWNLLEGGQAPMFGVFNAYERQVIHDWIAGDSHGHSICECAGVQNQRQGRNILPRDSRAKHVSLVKGERERVDIRPRTRMDISPRPDEFSSEGRLFRARLAEAADESAAMDLLTPWLSPVHHHTDVGLQATRIFAQLFRA